MPAGCEAVVMQEQTEQTDDGVRFTSDVRADKIFVCAVKILQTARWYSPQELV